MDAPSLNIKKFHEGLLNGSFSALETVLSLFKSIEEKDPGIGAFLSLNENEAIKAAEEADLKVARKEKLPALAGVPVAVKDNMCVMGLPATASSKILENYIASYDGGAVRKLKEAGAVIMGKTNLDEFAMGSSTENSAFKITRNPHDQSRVAGGSSGGSAAAVAAKFALGAFGSDTGGSIRQPAAMCGVVGLKPTYGTVSRSGLIAMASSLDQIGPFANTCEDAATLFNAVRGYDPMEATSVEREYKNDLISENENDLKKLKIGIPKEYFSGGLEPEIEQAIKNIISFYESKGFKTAPISLPHTKHALSCYYIIMPAEVSSNLARFDGIRYGGEQAERNKSLGELYLSARGNGFGEESKRRIILGTFVLSSGYYDAYYGKAQTVRSLIRKDFDEAFEKIDVVLTPVTPTRAFKIGEKTDDPLAMYLSDIFTIPASLAGLPAVSIPVKNISGLPIGFQLIGKHFREQDILSLGNYYEVS